MHHKTTKSMVIKFLIFFQIPILSQHCKNTKCWLKWSSSMLENVLFLTSNIIFVHSIFILELVLVELIQIMEKTQKIKHRAPEVIVFLGHLLSNSLLLYIPIHQNAREHLSETNWVVGLGISTYELIFSSGALSCIFWVLSFNSSFYILVRSLLVSFCPYLNIPFHAKDLCVRKWR